MQLVKSTTQRRMTASEVNMPNEPWWSTNGPFEESELTGLKAGYHQQELDKERSKPDYVEVETSEPFSVAKSAFSAFSAKPIERSITVPVMPWIGLLVHILLPNGKPFLGKYYLARLQRNGVQNGQKYVWLNSKSFAFHSVWAFDSLEDGSPIELCEDISVIGAIKEGRCIHAVNGFVLGEVYTKYNQQKMRVHSTAIFWMKNGAYYKKMWEKTDELNYHNFNTPRGWEHLVVEGIGHEEMLTEVEEWMAQENKRF
jgi:hypothetical protein